MVSHDTTASPRGYPEGTILGKSGRIHRVRAELALGKPLPPNAVVHHADGTKRANAPLVICQDSAYHSLLHARTRIVRAGGDPDRDALCSACKSVRPREQFYARSSGVITRVCRACQKRRNALRPKGHPRGWARRRFDASAIKAIRERVAAGESRRSLAREFKVGLDSILDIVNWRTYRDASR